MIILVAIQLSQLGHKSKLYQKIHFNFTLLLGKNNINRRSLAMCASAEKIFYPRHMICSYSYKQHQWPFYSFSERVLF